MTILHTPEKTSSPSVSNWKVYIILACDGKLYTGITTNICRRWKQHRTKRGAKFFMGRQPMTVIYLEGGHDRRSASQLEYQVKQYSHKEKWSLIINHYGPFKTKKQENQPKVC